LLNHQISKIFLNITSTVVPTYFTFHRCSNSMRNSILHALNASEIPVHCDAIIYWKRSWKVRNPDDLKPLWRQTPRQSNRMLALITGESSSTLTLPRFINIPFGNHCYRDAFSQLNSSRWHSTFSLIVINCICSHLTFRNWYVTFPPQFSASKTLRLGADVPSWPPSYNIEWKGCWTRTWQL